MPWTMPAESAPQDRVWMAFPNSDFHSVSMDPDEVKKARAAWSEVANAISGFEPVTMVVDPDDEEAARLLLDPGVDVVAAPLNDSWMRDFGPTFVHAQDGSVAAVTWIFNGWGQDSADSGKDAEVGPLVARLAGTPRVDSDLVNEGGGVVVDGNGTVVLTETVQLDPNRNPGISKAEVEAEMVEKIGARQVIWLKQGLYRDQQPLGTRGHADILVCFPNPGTVLVHTQRSPEHPDYEISEEIRAVFEAGSDATGNPWRIVEMPAPEMLRDEEDFVDLSYINHLVVNGAVIACVFDDPTDEEAMSILAAEYADREIVPIQARMIFAGGGGIHCITQNQPSPVDPASR